jgi:hypothetical protein
MAAVDAAVIRLSADPKEGGAYRDRAGDLRRKAIRMPDSTRTPIKPARLSQFALLVGRHSTPFDCTSLAPRSHRRRLNGQRTGRSPILRAGGRHRRLGGVVDG